MKIIYSVEYLQEFMQATTHNYTIHQTFRVAENHELSS
jgi:hypothetical protein